MITNLLFYILGIVTGLIVDGILLVTLLYFLTKIEVRLNQINSKLKQKGRIIEDDKNEVTDWVETLKEE